MKVKLLQIGAGAISPKKLEQMRLNYIMNATV